MGGGRRGGRPARLRQPDRLTLPHHLHPLTDSEPCGLPFGDSADIPRLGTSSPARERRRPDIRPTRVQVVSAARFLANLP